MIGFLRSTVVFAVIVLIVSVTIEARIDPLKRCLQPHEKYNSCGTACPDTCIDVINGYPDKPCTLECVVGCFCKKGYVRENEEANSLCIKAEECGGD